MSIRKNKIPQDLEFLGEMLSQSFQYPDHPEWSEQSDEEEAVTEAIQALRRIWPLMRLGQIFSPSLRDLLLGYLWEEEGKPAGVVLVDRRGSSNSWIVSTVATHPDYRRRGIARQLVSASVDLIKERGGERATLDVIAKNLPAYKLYESLGFEHFTSTLNLTYEQKAPIAVPELPAGYRLEKTSPFDWARRVELTKRITPQEIQTFEPIDPARFQQSVFLRALIPLINKMQNVKHEFFYVYHNADLIGRVNYTARTNQKGRHNLALFLDPAHAVLAEPMLGWLLNKVQGYSDSRIVEMGLDSWNEPLIEAAYSLGFEKRLEYHRLGVSFAQDKS